MPLISGTCWVVSEHMTHAPSDICLTTHYYITDNFMRFFRRLYMLPPCHCNADSLSTVGTEVAKWRSPTAYYIALVVYWLVLRVLSTESDDYYFEVGAVRSRCFFRSHRNVIDYHIYSQDRKTSTGILYLKVKGDLLRYSSTVSLCALDKFCSCLFKKASFRNDYLFHQRNKNFCLC